MTTVTAFWTSAGFILLAVFVILDLTYRSAK